MTAPLKPDALRSRIMASVKRCNTGPEIELRRALFSCGLRYRLRYKARLPGSPDVVFSAAKVAVFVDGCFWHACPIHGTSPKTNAEFWQSKLLRNASRDERVDRELAQMGWLPVRLWEHEVKDDLASCALKIWALVRSRER
jgi:DNA mismatch endonuclease (patch repair protein)